MEWYGTVVGENSTDAMVGSGPYPGGGGQWIHRIGGG